MLFEALVRVDAVACKSLFKARKSWFTVLSGLCEGTLQEGLKKSRE